MRTARSQRLREGRVVVQQDRFVHLRNPRGWRIECVSGSAWITQEGELDDTFLSPGQSHVAQSRAQLLLQALDDDCALQIRLERPRPAAR